MSRKTKKEMSENFFLVKSTNCIKNRMEECVCEYVLAPQFISFHFISVGYFNIHTEKTM